MVSKKNIEKNVDRAFQALQDPVRYEGNRGFEDRVMTAVKGEASRTVSFRLHKMTGWAAVVMLLINISLFTTQKFSVGINSNNVESFFENYELVPASSWDNYFEVDDLNSLDLDYEER